MSTSAPPTDGRRDEQAGEVDLGQQVLLVDQRHPAVLEAVANSCHGSSPDSTNTEYGSALRQLALRSPAAKPKISVKTSICTSRLEHRPADAEHRLLVADLDVAPDEEVQQFAVAQQLAPVDADPALARLDDQLDRVVNCPTPPRGKRRSTRR